MSDLGFPGSGGGREGSLYALDQGLNNVHSIKFTSLAASCGTLRACSQAKMLHFKFSILLSPSFSYSTTCNHHYLLSSTTCKYKYVLCTVYSILNNYSSSPNRH